MEQKLVRSMTNDLNSATTGLSLLIEPDPLGRVPRGNFVMDVVSR